MKEDTPRDTWKRKSPYYDPKLRAEEEEEEEVTFETEVLSWVFFTW